MAILSDIGNFVRQTFTPQQVQRTQPQQQPSFMDRVSQVINTNFLPGQQMTVSQAFNKATQNFSTDFGNVLRGTGGLQGQQLKNPIIPKVPILSNFAQMSANTGQSVATGMTGIARGGNNIVQGFKQGNPLKVGQGLVNTGFGAAQIAAAGTPLFTGANISTQLGGPLNQKIGKGLMQGMTGINGLAPNVKENKIKVMGMEFDPIVGVASLVGFTKNPAWIKIFGKTTKLVEYGLKGIVLKGGVEGLIQGMDQLPNNPTDKDIFNILGPNVLMGVGAEVGTKVAGDILKKVWKSGIVSDMRKQMLSPFAKDIVETMQGPMPRWKAMIKQMKGENVYGPRASELGIAESSIKLPTEKPNVNEKLGKIKVTPNTPQLVQPKINTNMKELFQERMNKLIKGDSPTIDKLIKEGEFPRTEPMLKADTQTKKTILNAFKLQGSKTFKEGEGRKFLDYTIETLGEKNVMDSYNNYLKYPKTNSLNNFHNEIKAKLQQVKPDWEGEWRAANESLMNQTTATPINKIKINKPLIQDIEELSTIHPSKELVTGKQAETAYKNLKTHGDTLVDRITNGIKHYKITQEQFSKYIENPLTAPPEIKPIIDAHMRLSEITHKLRENPNLGEIKNYFPHMSDESMNLPTGIKNIGKDLWISDFNLDLGSSKKRTGSMTDYSTEYGKVMKNYFEQVAYDKYGKRIGFTPKIAEFVKQMEVHLTPTKEGTFEPPNDTFDYVGKSSIMQEIKNKQSLFSKMEPIDTFDSLRRKIANEKGGSSLSSSMEQVRDMRDNIGGIELHLKKMKSTEQVNYLAENLTYNKDGLKNILNKMSLNGTKEIPESTIIALLRAEKNFRIQNFIKEVGKYEFGKETQSYLNSEIDRLMKVGKYESTLLEKAVNFITGTFYRAQIWGNLNTGLAQKGESLRIPVFYGGEMIAQGAKQSIIDLTTGKDILKRYDFSGVETDVSKHLLIKGKENALTHLGEKVSRVGNIFVNIGENSKNRDFLYAAEAQGKNMGLNGVELKTFVRNELFANGFILHEFNTPQMLKNPLVRLFLQYQQYNIKLFNRALEMGSSGQKGKAIGMVGAQVASAIILAILTGKGFNYVKDRLTGAPVGPGISLPIQMGTLMKEIYDAKKEEEETGKSSIYITDKNTKKLKDLTIRNTVPFANQFYKTKGAVDVLKQGYDTEPSGKVTYMAPTSNLDKTRGILFGKTSFDTNKNYYETGQKPLGEKQTALFKQEGASQQSYDKAMQERKETKQDNIARENVRESSQSKTIGSYFYYLDNKTGDVRRVDKNFYPETPKFTGNTELDKKLITKYKGDITSKANDIVELYNNKQITMEEAENELRKLKTLSSSFASAKKPKKVSFRKISIRKSSISNIRVKRLPSLKLIKQPKIKAIKFKKIKSLLTSAGKSPTIKIKA